MKNIIKKRRPFGRRQVLDMQKKRPAEISI